MKIFKGDHRAILLDLFYYPNPKAGMPGQSALLVKEYPLDQLFDASSAMKKLRPLVRPSTEAEILNYLKGKQVTPEEMENYKKDLKTTVFEDKEVEFTPSEIVILKELFDNKKNWSPEKADIIKELKDIFYPPIPLEK